MSDLDELDRLIDRLEADRFTRDPLHAAIQRLREVEANILATRGVAELEKASAEKWKRQAETYHSHVLQIQNGGQAKRIAQLERVREAAQALIDSWDYYEPLGGEALRIALAAVEEPAKT